MIKQKLLEAPFANKLILYMSAVNDEELFRSYLKDINSTSIVETGTHHGIGSALLCEYTDIVHTFDIIDYDLKYQIWEYLGVTNKIKFHLIKNDKEKSEILETLKYDYAFIDGNHSGGIITDYELLKKCGRILFHDYKKGFPPENFRSYVVKFIDSLGDYVKRKDQPFAYYENINKVEKL